MKATILIDSTRAGNMKAEWGLCIYVEYNRKKILIDTGASSNFLKNAKMCGISIKDVDAGILSHAHYDHADGLEPFFKENSTAKFYLLNTCKENCYSSRRFHNRYIGIKKGTLEKYKERFEFISGTYKLMDGVTLIPHSISNATAAENTSALGHPKGTLLVKNGRSWQFDNFNHEQIAVFDTEKGLVVFTSCAHNGVLNTIKDVRRIFPEKQIFTLAGGFHLHRKSEEYVAQIGKALAETEIKQIYTGHCTGEHSFEILKKCLGPRLYHLHTGLIMQL